MIESITVPLEQFNLKGFVEAYRKFYYKWAGDEFDADPSLYILESFKSNPVPNDEGLDPIEVIKKKKHMVFFQMHEPVSDDKTLCIDGKRRDSDDFDIGLEDGYGFLVELEGKNISLHPALYDGSSNAIPSIELQGTCSVLEECMKSFVQKFIKK